MEDNFKAAIAVIVTSVFWLFVLAVSHNGFDIEAYRQGYGEGKSGLPERWENSVGGTATK